MIVTGAFIDRFRKYLSLSISAPSYGMIRATIIFTPSWLCIHNQFFCCKKIKNYYFLVSWILLINCIDTITNFDKLKKEHTILEDFEKFLAQISKIEKIDRIIPGRIDNPPSSSSYK